MNEANEYSNVSTETLRVWIREAEYEEMMSPGGARQKLLDKYCAELGRRGED